MPSTEETIDIETSGATVPLRLLGANIVNVHIRGDNAADYQIDVRQNGGDWIQNVRSEYTGNGNYDDTFETGAEELRVRCASGTATADDQATITLMAS